MIPEPSEHDLSEAMWWIRNYRDGAYADVQTRVIAHLIRNGAVLAEMLQQVITEIGIDNQCESTKAAIALFEKLKEASDD